MLLIPTLLCPKSWESMSGNEAQRYCTYCQKHVYNLAALTAAERVALLTSPAASICSRYRVAIRRPVKGKEESYHRHLLKHGAAVALVGSVLLVLWEMHERASPQRCYRTGGARCSPTCDMPKDLYHEHQVLFVGDIVSPKEVGEFLPDELRPQTPPDHVDLLLDPVAVDRLIELAKPDFAPARPLVPVKLD